MKEIRFVTDLKTMRRVVRGKEYIYYYIVIPRFLSDKIDPGKPYVVVMREMS